MKNVKFFHQALITSSVLSCAAATCPADTYQIASQTSNLCSSKSIRQTLADTLAPAVPQLSPLTFTHLSIREHQSLLWRYCEGRHLYLGSLLLHCCLGSCLWGSNNYHSCAPPSVRSHLGNHTWLFSPILQPLRRAQVRASLFQRWEEIADAQGLLVVAASVPQRRCIWRRPSAENAERLSEQAAVEMQVGWGGKGTLSCFIQIPAGVSTTSVSKPFSLLWRDYESDHGVSVALHSFGRKMKLPASKPWLTGSLSITVYLAITWPLFPAS